MRIILFIICLYSRLICNDTKVGKFLPSEGNVHALFIFVQFPDDQYSPDVNNWKLNQPPDYMPSFVDNSVENISHNGNLSCYFDDMSMHKFLLTGKSIFITTPHSREWYYLNKKSRSFINSEIILKADTLINFTEFDRLKRVGEYKFEHSPDSIIDMIFIIYRNVGNDLADTLKRKIENQFGLVPGGEASLGYGKEINVDEGRRIVEMGYPGSGVNVKASLTIAPVSGCAHEFGHYLLGGNEVHFSSGIYGLMSTWGFTQRSIMMNGWERLQLGWVEPLYVGPDKGDYNNIKLKDFITSGDLIKINIPDSKEYFLLENHQQINKYWDVPDQSKKNVKGIYVLHQSGTSGSSVNLMSADGRWNWEVTEKVFNPYGGKDSLPVFTKLEEDPVNGRFDNEMIPYKYNGIYARDVIHFYRDLKTGEIIEKAIFRGDGGDSYNLQRNKFSGDTNPSPVLSNKKPAPIEFMIKSSHKEKDGIETYFIDIKIK